MNSVAKSFRQLVETLAHEPESASVEPLLAEVAARVSAADQVVCLGLQTRREWYWRLDAAASLLGLHSICLKARVRQQRDGLYLFAEVTDEQGPSPFAGAQVLELAGAKLRRAA